LLPVVVVRAQSMPAVSIQSQGMSAGAAIAAAGAQIGAAVQPQAVAAMLQPMGSMTASGGQHLQGALHASDSIGNMQASVLQASQPLGHLQVQQVRTATCRSGGKGSEKGGGCT
jgi:hypothetical protein